MPDLMSKRHDRIGPQLLRNALSKAQVAQYQLWDNSDGSYSALGGRQVESLSSILIAWVAIEGMVNEATHLVFDGGRPPVSVRQGTQESKLRECLRARIGFDELAEWEPMLARLKELRRFRNALVHYSPYENPAELRWESQVIGDGLAVGWMVGAPPNNYKEGLAERIDPEHAWEFCSVGILVGVAVYQTLGVMPELGKNMAMSKISPHLLPKEPTLDDLMSGIPMYQVERYLRALRGAQQYTEQWWVLQPDGRRRPYCLGRDMKRETMLTAFEGEPTEEALGEWWDDYYDSIPALAMKTKRIVRDSSGKWTLADPIYESIFSDLDGGDGPPTTE